MLDDMWRNVVGSGISKPTEAAIVGRDNILREHASELADLEAVEMVLVVTDANIRKSLEIVYFKDPLKELEKGDIETRVHFAEIHIPASRAQIYRWLSKARKIFTEARGLRT